MKRRRSKRRQRRVKKRKKLTPKSTSTCPRSCYSVCCTRECRKMTAMPELFLTNSHLRTGWMRSLQSNLFVTLFQSRRCKWFYTNSTRKWLLMTRTRRLKCALTTDILVDMTQLTNQRLRKSRNQSKMIKLSPRRSQRSKSRDLTS